MLTYALPRGSMGMRNKLKLAYHRGTESTEKTINSVSYNVSVNEFTPILFHALQHTLSFLCALCASVVNHF